MKKLFLTITLVLLFIPPLYSRETIAVYAAPASIWAWEKDGKLVGPVIDLAQGIFSDFGISVQPKIFPWGRAIKFVESGELDMILTIFYTVSRAKTMDFTIPYVHVPTSIFVLKGNTFPFSHLEDLIGRKGVKLIGASISRDFDRFSSNLDLVTVPDEEQIIRMLEKGRVDYAVGPQFVFLIQAKKFGYSDQIEFLPTPVDSRPLRFAFSKKSPFLKYLPQVNEKIKTLQDNGAITKMLEEAIDAAALK